VQRARGKVTLHRGCGGGGPGLRLSGPGAVVPPGPRVPLLLVVTPRLWPLFRSAGRMFETVADEADTLFEPFECGEDGREVFH
jgi:hypothetical protein